MDRALRHPMFKTLLVKEPMVGCDSVSSPQAVAFQRVTIAHENILYEWMIELQEQFKLSQSSVLHAFGLFEQYVTKCGVPTNHRMQLVACVCLYIADSRIDQCITPRTLKYMSEDAFTYSEFTATVFDMMECFGCKTHLSSDTRLKQRSKRQFDDSITQQPVLASSPKVKRSRSCS